MIKHIKITKTRIIIAVIILIIVGYFAIKTILKNPLEGFIIEPVKKGEVVQEVFETGNIKATEDVSLSFKVIGRVAKINTAVGENVKKGSILAELDKSYIFAQLQAAQAALNSATTQYEKLIRGLTPEEIKVYENAVISAQQELKNIYNGALNILNNAYIYIYNAYNTAVSVQNNYFLVQDQESIRVSNAKSEINSNMQNAKKFLDLAAKNLSESDIDNAISHMLSALKNVYANLKIIREQCDEGIYYYRVSASDKSSLDAHIININSALNSVTNLENNIASCKANLKTAEDNLASKTAKPREEDINIYQSQIKQAEANISALESQLNDNYLISPIDGKITEINIKRGQIVSPSQPVIKLLSMEPFQIKTAIYEKDIVNVKVGDEVKINLVAFPRQTFSGKVLSIDPAETIINNVVYYGVTIEFFNQPADIRSGMTADITIETNKREDVLRVPKNAVVQIEGKDFVQVVKGKKIENREITVGIEGNDYFEVLSGLSEGEKIIIGKK